MEVTAFLSYLARESRGGRLDPEPGAVRASLPLPVRPERSVAVAGRGRAARRPARLPTVLTVAEVQAVLGAIAPSHRLPAALLSRQRAARDGRTRPQGEGCQFRAPPGHRARRHWPNRAKPTDSSEPDPRRKVKLVNDLRPFWLAAFVETASEVRGTQQRLPSTRPLCSPQAAKDGNVEFWMATSGVFLVKSSNLRRIVLEVRPVHGSLHKQAKSGATQCRAPTSCRVGASAALCQSWPW